MHQPDIHPVHHKSTETPLPRNAASRSAVSSGKVVRSGSVARRLTSVAVTLGLLLFGLGALAAPANAAPPTYIVKGSTTLAGGTAGAGVAVDPARGLVYVAQRGANQVEVLDEATLSQVAIIPVPNQPYNIAVEPTSGAVYVSEYTGNNLPGSLAVIDPTTRVVVATLPTGNSPVGVAYNPADKRIYVANYSSSFLSVFDATNPLAPTTLPSIAMPGTSETITVNPAGSTLYVATSGSNVWLVDTTTGVVTTTWTGFSFAHQVAFSSDNASAFISQQGAVPAAIFSLASNTKTGTIPFNSTYYQSQDLTNGTSFMTVPFQSGGLVAILDAATGAVAQTLPAPYANYIATDPTRHLTFVTSIVTGTLTKIGPAVDAPVVNTNLADVTVTEGDTATFTADATSTAPQTVQWQQSTDGGTTFTDIPGATTNTLTIPDTTLAQSGAQYRAVFTNAGGTATTTAATLTVTSVTPPGCDTGSSGSASSGSNSGSAGAYGSESGSTSGSSDFFSSLCAITGSSSGSTFFGS